MKFGKFFTGLAFIWLSSAPLPALAADLPAFNTVLTLLQSNLVAVSDVELDRLAVEGLLQQLAPRAAWMTNNSAAPVDTEPRVSKQVVFDQAFGYLRIAAVNRDLHTGLARAFAELNRTNKLKGLVLDLRFAGGNDYEEAVRVADLFLANDQPLMEWAGKLLRSSAKTNAIDLPLAILINAQTTGAAEALAALLRHFDAGLVMGNPTTGTAFVFREFTLPKGQRLKIAVDTIKFPAVSNQTARPLRQVQPDIAVEVPPADEKIYFDDAFKEIVRQGGSSSAPETITITTTNRPRRRLNEAELVRMRREGIDPETEFELGTSPRRTLDQPLMQDPVLSRALDLLKGISVVQPHLRKS